MQDVICNGRSPFHRLLQQSSSKTQHHEAISVKLIQDGKTSRLFCTQNEPQKHGDCKDEGNKSMICLLAWVTFTGFVVSDWFVCIAGRKGSTVNGEFILPKMAVNEELQHSVHRAEEQTHQLHCTASYIHTSSDITSPSHRKPACRKVKVKKSTKRM